MAYNFNGITNVRNWFCGILPLVYDNALSYYEQICKFTDKLNEVINTTNEMGEALASITGGGKDYYINVTNPGGTYKPLVGDGNTDNTEAFQALANIDNAVLFFPAGIYATKSVTCKCDIVGAGALDSQILCLNDNTTNAGIIMANNANIYSIGINGNKGGQSEEKSCLSLTSGNMAVGVQCYNGHIGLSVPSNNCQFLGQFERCTQSALVTGSHNLIVATEDSDTISDTGESNNIITNYRFSSGVDTFKVNAKSVDVLSNGNITTNALGTNTVKGKNVQISATETATISAHDVTETIGGDKRVNADNIIETATENRTIDAKNVGITGSNSVCIGGENVGITGSNSVCIGGESIIAKETTSSRKVDLIHRGYLNVKDYGAVGDGVTDDYQAFAKCLADSSNGEVIIVPDGKYVLSQNPYPASAHVSSTDVINDKLVDWAISNGASFTGAGAGDPSTGKGTFASPFLTNPWLVISGDSQVYDLNELPNPEKGALVANSKELAPINSNATPSEHMWHCLEYRGACTGNKDNTRLNVELLNQVLNITGCKGIATEIDVNMYARPEGFSAGLFLTGGGDGGGDSSAIDITRDEGSTKWTNGISIRRGTTGIYIDNAEVDVGLEIGDVGRKATPCIAAQQKSNGADGIVIRRNTDTSPTGNLMVMWNAGENEELFAVSAKGEVRSAVPLVQSNTFTKNGTFSNAEYTIPISTPVGKHAVLTSECSSIGFAAPVWVTERSDTAVKVFVNGSGTGSIKVTVLFA